MGDVVVSQTGPTDGPVGTGGDGAGDVPPHAGPPVPRRPRKIFLLVGLVVAAGLAIGLFTSVGSSNSSNGRPVVGGGAPPFTLPRLGASGSVGTPADGGGHGRPAVVLFFASWCGPCQSEIPAVAAAVRRQHGAGGPTARVAVVGVDTLDPTANALAFVRRAGVTFPVGVDAQAAVTNGKYSFTGDPEAVYIKGDGTIAHITYGPTTPAELARWESRLVGR